MIFAILGIAIGGILKGATGAGAPIIAVPVLSIFYGVPFAVTVFSVPNLLSNVWQGWAFRNTHLPWPFVIAFSVAGALGALIGTVILANLAQEALLLVVAFAVFGYIAFRLLRPGWTLAFALAQRLVLPLGFVAGVLQGASGVSAPVSITFLNAMRLDRAEFISTISIFFAAMTAIQIPMLAFYGFMNFERIILGFGAMALIVAFMPVGALLARYLSKEAFDRVILLLLAAVAVRLVVLAL